MRARSALVAAFERAGFTLIRQRKHMVWRCPCGHAQVTCPSTPGRGRSTDNSHGNLARTLRACSPGSLRECA